MSEVYQCEACRNNRWLHGPNGVRPCACIYRATAGATIPAMLRGNDAYYPERLVGTPRWPAKDRVLAGGSWDEFRWMAWRSYEELQLFERVRAQVANARDIIDREFGKLEGEKTMVGYVEPALLIIRVDRWWEYPTAFPRRLCHLVEMRRDLAKPTWIYLPYDVNRLRREWGADVVEFLNPVSAVDSQGMPAEASASTAPAPAPAQNVGAAIGVKKVKRRA